MEQCHEATTVHSSLLDAFNIAVLRCPVFPLAQTGFDANLNLCQRTYSA